MKSINFVVPAKNVVLGGVKSVTLHDDRNVEMTDLSSQVSIGIETKPVHYYLLAYHKFCTLIG